MRWRLATPTTATSALARSRSWRRWRETAKGPHLRFVWLSENVDEVRGVLAELWAGSCWLWCSGELVRARRSNGNCGGPLWPLRKGEEKQETKCGARRLTGTC